MSATSARQENRSVLFIGGMLIGALAAALLSPRSGQDMRNEVKEKAKDMKDKIENKKEELKKKKDEAAEKADEKIDETKTRLQQARDKTNNTNQ